MKPERIEAGRLAASSVATAFLHHKCTPFALLFAMMPALFLMPITHDEIWQVWIGQQLLHGAKLYTDIIEVNPPLWFWIAVPLAATNLDPRVAVIAFFSASILLSLLMTPSRYRLLALVVLTLLPLHDFGQREHFTLIATTPYVFLIAQRAKQEPVRYPLAIGFFAAVGFALKPYFVVVPLVLEIMVRKRLRPEVLVLACSAVAYTAAVLVFTPAYLASIVPLAIAAYRAFGGGPSIPTTLVAFVLCAAGLWLNKRSGDTTSRAIFLAALLFLPSALLQAKGWYYQSLPARGLLFMSVAVELLRRRSKPFGDSLLVAAAIICIYPLGVYRNDYAAEMNRHLTGIPRGASILVVANNPSVAWPTVYQHGLKWDLREFSVWQLQGMKNRPELKPEAQMFVDDAFAKHPDIVIIDRQPRYRKVARSLVPDTYLRDYRFNLRTPDFDSYVRNGFVTGHAVTGNLGS